MESKRFVRVVYFSIAAVMLVGMVFYSGHQEFWYDEVYQTGLVGKGLGLRDLFRQYMQLKDYTPPLFAFAAYIWIRIVPFSFRYLLLISEAMTAVGVFVAALTGEKIGGKKMGVVTEIFAATSSVLVLSAGYEFRSYALYFLAVSLVFYCLASRICVNGKRDSVCFTIALMLLLYSHYYGSVVFGVLFVLELVFLAVRKQKGIVLVPYILAGISFLPWLILVFLNRTRSITEFWIQPPGVQSLLDLINFLCSENAFLVAVFCIGLACCLVHIAGIVRRKQFDFHADAMKVYVSGVLLGVIALMYFYGAFINPSGGIFYNRYFVGMLPCCFLISAYGVLWIWDGVGSRFHEKKQSFAILCASLLLFTFVQNGETFFCDIMKEQKLSYTATVRELGKKEDIKSPGTVVVTSDNSHVRAGVEMYFEDMFHITDVTVISQHDEGFGEKIEKYQKVYLFKGKQPLTDETKKLLSGYEKLKSDSKNRITEYIVQQKETIDNEKDERQ